jgi:hypothetical protein
VNPVLLVRLAGRRDAHEVTQVRTALGVSHGHPVRLGDDVVYLHPEIRKAGPEDLARRLVVGAARSDDRMVEVELLVHDLVPELGSVAVHRFEQVLEHERLVLVHVRHAR